jgi:hypothetical protein
MRIYGLILASLTFVALTGCKKTTGRSGCATTPASGRLVRIILKSSCIPTRSGMQEFAGTSF